MAFSCVSLESCDTYLLLLVKYLILINDDVNEAVSFHLAIRIHALE